ncbi:unnamed protein product [Ilex paraguariensis]|uniref:Uncharacterized protein n=1 Tax=Ilex paraguariensis TaxID=185542 RepID=A0ABC8TJH7_9AQUA
MCRLIICFSLSSTSLPCIIALHLPQIHHQPLRLPSIPNPNNHQLNPEIYQFLLHQTLDRPQIRSAPPQSHPPPKNPSSHNSNLDYTLQFTKSNPNPRPVPIKLKLGILDPKTHRDSTKSKRNIRERKCEAYMEKAVVEERER